MVEFVLVLPLLVLLLVALLDFGRMMIVHAAVVTASREGARYGAAVGPNADGDPRYVDCVGIRNAVHAATDALLTLAPEQIAITYVDGAGSETATACPPLGAGPAEEEISNLDRVVVTVTYEYQAIVPMVHSLVGPITVISVDRRTIITGDL